MEPVGLPGRAGSRAVVQPARTPPPHPQADADPGPVRRDRPDPSRRSRPAALASPASRNGAHHGRHRAAQRRARHRDDPRDAMPAVRFARPGRPGDGRSAGASSSASWPAFIPPPDQRCDLEATLDRYPEQRTGELREILARQAAPAAPPPSASRRPTASGRSSLAGPRPGTAQPRSDRSLSLTTASSEYCHMAISVFDLFQVGIGPSSSHTVGPMRGGRDVRQGPSRGRPDAAGGDRAGGSVLLARPDRPGARQRQGVAAGLEGEQPATVDVDAVPGRLEAIAKSGTLAAARRARDPFTLGKNLEFNRRKKLGYHPNGSALHRLRARRREPARAGPTTRSAAARGRRGAGRRRIGRPATRTRRPDLPYPFTTGEELLARTRASGLPVSVHRAGQRAGARRTAGQVRADLGDLWQSCGPAWERGCATDGMLPGGLKVPRRAPRLFRQLTC